METPGLITSCSSWESLFLGVTSFEAQILPCLFVDSHSKLFVCVCVCVCVCARAHAHTNLSILTDSFGVLHSVDSQRRWSML